MLKDLAERDVRDEMRAIAPLKPAADAVIIDTSELDANEVFERVKGAISNPAVINV
jgi:cytidylate kinase